MLVIGLGSNLGDRLGNLRAAAREIGLVAGIEVRARSSVVCSAPVGGPPQADYLNGALGVLTALSPRSVLERAREIEVALGRPRPDPVRWGPRLIDIDLLWMAGVIVEEPDLLLPHPRLTERAFAMQPLLEVVPDAKDPRTGEPYGSFLAARWPLRKVGPL